MHLNAAIAMPKQLSMEARNSLVLSGKRATVKRKRQPNLEVVAAHNHIGGFQPTQASGAHRRRDQEKRKPRSQSGFDQILTGNTFQTLSLTMIPAIA